MARGRWAALVVALLVGGFPPRALAAPDADPHAAQDADRAGTPDPPPEDGLPPPSAPPGETRPVPRYNPRPDPEVSAGDVLIWVPRAVAYPAHLVLEMVVRRPVVGLISVAEEHHIPGWIRRLFIWRDGRAGLFPTFYYEFGLDPSVGAYFFHDDLLRPGHRLVLRGGFWGEDWIRVLLDNRFRVFRDDSGTIDSELRYVRRPDYPYHGVGAGTLQDDASFFRAETLEASVGLTGAFGELNRTALKAVYRHVAFDHGDGPLFDEGSDGDQISGFDGYDLLSVELRLELDSRSADRLSSTGSGLRLELFASFNDDPARPDRHFVRWGGEAAGFLDLTGANHVLGLRVYTELAEQTGAGPVPVTELPMLGGRELMRGFLEGRFRGPSALVVTAEYRYPVWSLVDATLFVDAGNAFDEHLANLHAKRLHLSWGLGVRSNNARNVSFDVLLAFGSNRLDEERFEVDYVHFVLGVNSGF